MGVSFSVKREYGRLYCRLLSWKETATTDKDFGRNIRKTVEKTVPLIRLCTILRRLLDGSLVWTCYHVLYTPGRAYSISSFPVLLPTIFEGTPSTMKMFLEIGFNEVINYKPAY